ncbi:SPOR domain-containing protein [Erythrobacter sp. HL-111]|uniref:SPOR domain-containing protein n=1 Tax=Erythrobacter sp. HL-111 TaxID=1798193 RepID=UPI0006DA3C56|nr:SPOR domain-containing protein [Erythrobacter sp. HL-111]KPP91230.1 MAG: TPR repeat protein SEL1 subfamily [Erythrobacteraceae bacterium HL-111]SDT06773.1 TPR repeat [Erythrobacter sp. HL-111]
MPSDTSLSARPAPCRLARAFARSPAGPAALLLALAATPGLANVKDGVDAWSAGDYGRAVAEWQGPATNGDPDALFNLAQAYRLGRGVEADIARARELYAEAAQKGHAKAADNYGLLLFQQGAQESAMPLIRDAADRGDPRAQYVLGLAHFNADYAPKDWVRAYALLTLARSQGLPQATEALAQMDRYVPDAQKSAAQSLARQLEEESARRRSAQLAAADLGRMSAAKDAPAPVAAAAGTPAQMAEALPQSQPQTGREPQPGPQRSARPDPAPVLVAALPEPREAAPPRTPPAPVPAAVSASASGLASGAGAQAAPSAARARPQPVRVEAAARPRGKWRVQLGAFGVPGNAERLWRKLADNPALAGTERALVPAGRVTKLQAVGFARRSDARAACSALAREGQACIVAAPGS